MKAYPVTEALGPVTISLRFHLLFTRTHYLENSSHQQCDMQFKLSNSICLEERKQSFRV